MLVLYLHYDWHDPRRPAAAVLSQGWWSFSDQGRYLTDALAWAAGNLDPAAHWYMPGYALLAVPFLHMTAANPFLLPDAALLLGSLWLTAAIAGELLPGWRIARPLGALAFLLSAAIPATMEVWVTPWTTTPATPLILGCLWSLLRYLRHPASWRLALAASLCAAGIVAFRPSDGVLFLLLTPIAGVLRLITARPGWPATLRVAGAAALGVVLPAAVIGALYVAVNGFRASDYLTFSAALGFEWRMLPLQWVTIVLDPQPMLPDGHGLLPVYPFIATGLAGMAACLAAPPGRSSRTAHALIVAAVLCYGALYLCYRDLHPPGLWRYYNYHYFKWLLPLFALYTALLVVALTRWQAALAAVCVLAAILPWRAQVVTLPTVLPRSAPGHIVALPGHMRIGQALAVPAEGTFEQIFTGVNYFYFAHDTVFYGGTGSIAAYPIPGGLMLAPVRPVGKEPGRAVLDPGVALNPAVPPRVAKIELRYGRPCFLPGWLGNGGAACRFDNPIPAPIWPAGTVIPFDTSIRSYLTDGWSPAGPADLWTDGDQAGLRGRVQPAPRGNAILVVKAHGFIPAGTPPLEVEVEAGGAVRGHWMIPDTESYILHTSLPAAAFSPDGLVDIRLHLINPRRPSDFSSISADSRLLGLAVESAAIEEPGQ